MKKLIIFLFCTAIVGCSQKTSDSSIEQKAINSMLDQWHEAASKADYQYYFRLMSEESVFIGTDATENWNKAEFMIWSKPYFDKGKAWSFTSMERNIYFDANGTTAWFDELLNTQMKICRGSGVVVKEGKDWKIKQYVLSMTFPNDSVDAVIKIKAPIEDEMIQDIISKK